MAQSLLDLQLQKKFSRERDCISGKQREQENYPPELQHKMMEKRSMKAKKKRAQEDAMTRERGTKLGFTTYQFWKCRLYSRQRDGA
jgi:hypothetical protein